VVDMGERYGREVCERPACTGMPNERGRHCAALQRPGRQARAPRRGLRENAGTMPATALLPSHGHAASHAAAAVLLALGAAAAVFPPPSFAAGAAAQDAGEPEAAPSRRPVLAPSADGASVLDERARLAWPRCVEGMQWTGRSCAGEARLFTYSQAQALAQARWKAEGVRWRLPRVPELRRLVDRTRQPAIVDPVLFPATPMEWHWTGTASVNTATVNPYNYGTVARGGSGESGLQAQQGWAVDMETGEARGNIGKGTRLPVRLVRPMP